MFARSHGTFWFRPVGSAALILGMVLATGASEARADGAAHATPALTSDLPAEPELARKLASDLAVLQQKIGAHLDARALAKADAIVGRVASEPVAAPLEQADPNVALSSERSNGVENRLDELEIEVRGEPEARVEVCNSEPSVAIAAVSSRVSQ